MTTTKKDVFERLIEAQNSLGASYRVEKCGRVQKAIFANKVIKLIEPPATDYGSEAKSIINCCKAVEREVRQFEKEYGKRRITKQPTYHKNTSLIEQHIGKKCTPIDLTACYWNILHHSKVISDATHQEYLKNKPARLIAVGMMNKSTFSYRVVAGKKIKNSENVKRSPHSWVWNFVVSEAWAMYNAINNEVEGRVLKFKTDCVYLLQDDIKTVINWLDNHSIRYRVNKKEEIKL